MAGSAKGERTTQKETGSNFVDQGTQDYLNKIRGAGQAAGAAGPSPLLGGASDYYSGLMKGGNLGFGALSGDAASAQQLMNPYQNQVIDQNNAQWQKINAQTANQVDDAATRAGAFGGSRHGVAAGVALANNNQAQAGQTAGLLNQGYSDMQQRAASLAGLGFAGAGQNANLGFGGVGSPDAWMLNMLKQGYMGPLGQQQQSGGSTATTQGGFGFKVPFLG